MIDNDLFEPYEKLIRVELLGRRVEVPENNTLLRCLQFLSPRGLVYGDLCWNGDCGNCQFWYREEGQADGEEKTALACRFRVREGLRLTRLTSSIRLDGAARESHGEPPAANPAPPEG